MTAYSDEATWPIAVLTSIFAPDFEPQTFAMAIGIGYFDVQKATKSDVFAVSGFVSSKARWRQFEER
jgi:hypothetical protein